MPFIEFKNDTSKYKLLISNFESITNTFKFLYCARYAYTLYKNNMLLIKTCLFFN